MCYSNVSMHFRIILWKLKIIIKKYEHICLWGVWSKILSSSLYTLLKSSKTTSPNKLFDYDCVTLYCIFFLNRWRISLVPSIICFIKCLNKFSLESTVVRHPTAAPIVGLKVLLVIVPKHEEFGLLTILMRTNITKTSMELFQSPTNTHVPFSFIDSTNRGAKPYTSSWIGLT